MVSNGEYVPYPQTEKQKQVEHRIKELADVNGRNSDSAGDNFSRPAAAWLPVSWR
jgi:hypothetical protein